MDNLKKAHKNAKKGKGWYQEVKQVDQNLEKALLHLQDSLIEHTYKTSKYKIFYKKRGQEREGNLQITVLSRQDMPVGDIASNRALSVKNHDNRYLQCHTEKRNTAYYQ